VDRSNTWCPRLTAAMIWVKSMGVGWSERRSGLVACRGSREQALWPGRDRADLRRRLRRCAGAYHLRETPHDFIATRAINWSASREGTAADDGSLDGILTGPDRGGVAQKRQADA
jgi:hypothetical protein